MAHRRRRAALATAAAALGAAASGGAFLTYSTLTTAGLARRPASERMAAMQAVNREAPRSATFMITVFGPGLQSCVVGARAALDSRPGTIWVVAGAAVYVVGVVGMTVTYHVPRNTTLAGLDAVRDAGTFPGWLRSWVRGNHVRTVGGLVAGALLGMGALTSA